MRPKSRIRHSLWLLAVTAIFAAPQTAWAHAQVDVGAGLVGGLLHPVFGVDHLIAMVAVGLWGAQLKKPLIWALPIAFPMMMAVGGVMGVIGMELPAVEIGVAVSAMVLGLLVAFSVKAPQWLAILIVAVFAVFHGHAHGYELPHAAHPLAYGVGFVTSTGLLHLAGILIGRLNETRSYGAKIVRGCGGVIAALGSFFLLSTLGAF